MSPRYHTDIQCEVCTERFSVEFENPGESFEARCPNCNTHYPELYV